MRGKLLCLQGIVFLAGLYAPLPADATWGASCANVNRDNEVDLSDAASLLNWLFAGGRNPVCPDPLVVCGDTNGDGSINLSDAIYLLRWLFDGEPDPDCEETRLAGFTAEGTNDYGYREYRHDVTGIVFVLLPGGTYAMGAQGHRPTGLNYDPDANTLGGREDPVHDVTLTPFLIAKYEVTQQEWEQALGDRPSGFQGEQVPEGTDASRLPVENVSWHDIQRFEEASGLTLPTEAQWEYACRAGADGPFAGTGRLGEMGWYLGNSGGRTHEVGRKRPNAFGLHDMQGNVREWCEDIYDERFYSKPEAIEADPLSVSGSVLRVVRGGDWDMLPAGCRAAYRYREEPHFRNSHLGFRPAQPVAATLEVEGDRLDFGVVQLGKASTLRLTLRNLGALPLKLTGIHTSPGTSNEFGIPLPTRHVSPGARLDVEVSYTPRDEGKDRGSIALSTEDGTTVVRLLGGGVNVPDAPEIPGLFSLGPNRQGYPEYQDELTGITFVLLPGGTFWMGAQSGSQEGPNYDPAGWSPDEGPVHQVTLTPFLIGKREVTQAQWERVMGRNPSYFQVGRVPAGVDPSQLPVEMVSWNDAKSFVVATGLALPTEAQWEYACRAGVEGQFSGTGRMGEVGWYRGNSGGRTHQVGTKAPNQFGLHDMHGNVHEWCEDVYDPSFYARPESSGPDPVATSGSARRVLRSSFWNDIPWNCRAAFRFAYEPDFRSLNFGFRVAMPLR